MAKLGICSITFRDLSCEELIDEVKKAGLDAIEWGSDVHVPPNDKDHAKKVADLTKKAGLEVSSYGSYYRVGIENDYSFEEILETAVILGAKDIRVWAGRKGSTDASVEYFEAVVKDSQRIAEMAKASGIRVGYEYHGKTLTDTIESTLKLLEAVDNENIQLYWQPSVGLAPETRLSNIAAVGKYITNVHVFKWKEIERLPLEEGVDEWVQYIRAINEHSADTASERYYLLEFVKDDSLEQFRADAKALKEIIHKVNSVSE